MAIPGAFRDAGGRHQTRTASAAPISSPAMSRCRRRRITNGLHARSDVSRKTSVPCPRSSAHGGCGRQSRCILATTVSGPELLCRNRGVPAALGRHRGGGTWSCRSGAGLPRYLSAAADIVLSGPSCAMPRPTGAIRSSRATPLFSGSFGLLGWGGPPNSGAGRPGRRRLDPLFVAMAVFAGLIEAGRASPSTWTTC